MKKFLVTLGTAVVVFAAPAAAHHVDHLDIPFPSRGACESFSAHLSAGDKDYLQNLFPEIFGTAGDVESFLTRAFACEVNPDDGQWYITDYREPVLDSDWFARKQAH